MSKKSELQSLPFGSEFSPNQIDLPVLLEICQENEGNKELIEKSIIKTFFSDKSNYVATLGMNCRLGLQNYKLLDDSFNFTEIGRNLYENRKEDQLYWMFCKHILLNVNGLLFIECLREKQMAGERITLSNMKKVLEERGLTYPNGGKHPSIMRLWLDKIGLVNKKWEVDEEVLNKVLEMQDKTPELSELNELQLAFLKALINSGVKDPQPTSNVVKLAEGVYGLSFPEKNLPKLVLNKLVESGFVTVKKTTKGRGAKPFLVQLSPSVNPDVILPAMAQLKKRIDIKLLELIRKPMNDILYEIKSQNTYKSGLALEALAFKLMQLLDMEYIGTRLRAEQTGGAEVDLLFESARLVYSRWQIQCKNTKQVALDPVAKEVGLTHFLKSNVIIVVTTGTFTSEARKYSNAVMKDSNLSIVLIEGKDIGKIAQAPSSIVDILNKDARNTMKIKKIEM